MARADRTGKQADRGSGGGPVGGRVGRSANRAAGRQLVVAVSVAKAESRRQNRQKAARGDGLVRPEGGPAATACSRSAATGAEVTEGSIASIDIRPTATLFRTRTPKRRQAIRHLPEHPVVRTAPPAWMLEECQVAPARATDQVEILQLLGALPHPPTKAEFHAAVDHPEHDAANRLVARLAGRIVGHVEIHPRTLLVGGVPLRGAVVDRVMVLPECRGAGHGQRLVRAAEARLAAVRAVIAFARTRVPASFQELGWSVLGRDRATPGRPAEILARLLDAPQREGEVVTMRQWRHVELPAILRIYGQNSGRFAGPVERGEAYSRWLVSRGGFDSLLVALVGQDRYDLHETSARIVGYCIQSGNRVLELLADPEFPGVEREILARVCAEAIENDRQEITFESAAADPLHAAVAGGEPTAVQGERMIVARIQDPQAVLEALVPSMGPRLSAGGVADPVELGLDCPAASGQPGFRGSIVVADGRASLQVGRIGRSYLKLSADELTRLVLGQCDPLDAVARGSMVPSTQAAVRFATWLFPRLPLWCPIWDDVPA
ncbi:MAG: GNAT family N-acetyltransferase [Planctomycetia bacterium]|nr:GNAT family N-acetyltransferase [Planctomycetia bacterium]